MSFFATYKYAYVNKFAKQSVERKKICVIRYAQTNLERNLHAHLDKKYMLKKNVAWRNPENPIQ